MNVVCYIALDRYGASALAGLSSLLKENGHEKTLERCAFFWANGQTRPSSIDYWSEDLPPWTMEDPEKEPFGGLLAGIEGNGKSRSAVTLDAFRKAGRQDAGFDWLFNRFVPDTYGRTDVETVNLVFTGTFGAAGTSAALVGLLERVAEMRRSGRLSFITFEYAVVGLGSEEAEDTDPQRTRALSARSLIDVQKFMALVDDDSRTAALYVIGDEHPPGNTLDRETRVDIAAAALLSISSEAGQPLVETENRFFRFNRHGGAIFWVRPEVRCESSRPFVVLGASLIRFPERTIQRLLATRFVSSVLRCFEKSDPDGEARDEPSENVVQAAAKYGADLPAAFAEELGRAGIKVDSGTNPFSWAGVGAIVDYLMYHRWNKATNIYSPDFFRRLPLEDWHQTMDELEEFMETAILARRERDLAELPGLCVLSLHEGLCRVFDEIGASAWREDIDFAPRRVCLQILGALGKPIRQALEVGPRTWRLDKQPLDDSELAYLGKQIGKKKKVVLDTLPEVPSRVAVSMRTIGLLSVGVLILLGFPVNLGLANPAWIRVLIGIGLGAAGSALLVWHFRKLQKKLLDALKAWVEAFQEYHDEKDKYRALDASVGTLQKILEYLDWLLDLSEDAPEEFDPFSPMPRDDKEKEGDRARRLEKTPALNRRFLTRFEEDVREGARTWAEIGRTLVNQCRDSSVTMTMPALFDSDTAILSKVFPNALGAERELDNGKAREQLKVLERWAEGRTDPLLEPVLEWLPFAGGTRKQRWALDAMPPDGATLLDPAMRAGNPAFGFYALARNYSRDMLAGSLVSVIAASFDVDIADLPGTLIAGNRLFIHLDQASSLPAPVNKSGRDYSIVFSSGQADFLAAQTGAPVEVFGENLLCHIRAHLPLGAEDIVFGGDLENPRSLLGRAFKAVGEKIPPLECKFDE